jgi:hypothetical protein
MGSYISNVSPKCGRIAQRVHALSLDGKLCPVWTAHPERKFATVVLDFDRTVMRRECIGEQLCNSFVGQRVP